MGLTGEKYDMIGKPEKFGMFGQMLFQPFSPFFEGTRAHEVPASRTLEIFTGNWH